MNTFQLTLDLDKGNSLINSPVIIRQGDKNGTEVRAEIFDHGQALSLSGYTWHLCMRLPNSDQYYRTEAVFANGVATATINENSAAAIVGTTGLVHFEAVSGTKEYSTQDFTVIVLPDPTADAELAEPYDSRIEQALAELDDATGRIAAMVQDATEEYLEAHPELTTTVEDNSLTDAKLVQSGGILDRVARLWHRLDNLLTATPAESDALTVTDAAKTPLAGLALYGRSTQSGTPTPSSPVAIQSVTPNLYHLTRQVDGTNVSATNMANLSVVDEVLTFTANNANAYYGGAQSAGQAYVNNVGFLVPVKGGLTYALCASNPFMNQLIVTSYDADKVSLGYTDAVVIDGRRLFTTPADAAYIGVRIGLTSATVGTTYSTSFAVYETDIPSVCVPYGYGGLDAVGRNLLSAVDFSISSGGVTGSFSASSGLLTISGSTSGTTDVLLMLKSPIQVPEGEVLTFSLPDGTISMSSLTVYARKADGSFLAGRVVRPTTTSVEMSDAGGSTIVEVRVRCNQNSGTINVSTHPMLVYGSTPATEYVPYAESTTPIDLQGHALRSLPDGTRDEVSVDQYGNAVLVQRVGSYTVTGEEQTVNSTALGSFYRVGLRYTLNDAPSVANATSGWCSHAPFEMSYSGQFVHSYTNGTTSYIYAQESTLEAALAAFVGAEIQYPLATPVTIDLGTIDPVALQGPDLTAQAVPTAPFALTYERDLNVTLARLEAAIADAATA